MKYNILLLILFVIVTTVSAVHETEHIYNQDTSECLVCVLDHSLVSPDIDNAFYNPELFHYNKISFHTLRETFHSVKSTNQNRAPPKIS